MSITFDASPRSLCNAITGEPFDLTRLRMARKHATELPLLLGNQLCFAIYSTAHFRSQLEKKARENLARSLIKLDAG